MPHSKRCLTKLGERELIRFRYQPDATTQAVAGQLGSPLRDSAGAGAKKASISASKIIPGSARGCANEPMPEEYIPDRYNSRTELKVDVAPDGTNVFDFRLVGKR